MYSLLFLCLDIYVALFQCLQRIWKRASGRWRGSCCSWRKTWRRFPPTMTLTTCSSPKWLYPLDMHLFTRRYGESFKGRTRGLQWILKKMSLKNVVFLKKVNKLPGSHIHHIIKGFYELVSRPFENQNVFQDIWLVFFQLSNVQINIALTYIFLLHLLDTLVHSRQPSIPVWQLF